MNYYLVLFVNSYKGFVKCDNMDQLKTGDILLFSERPTPCWLATLDCLIKCCTNSKYSHAALVVIDPPWAPHLKGTFVWESSWHGTPDPQDNIIKYGVQLTPLSFYTDRYPGTVSIWLRRGQSKYFDPQALIRIHNQVYCHKYDSRPKDWCAALFKKRIANQTDVFTCSAFVSFVLTSLGVLSIDTPWTIVSAAELSDRGKVLNWRIEYGIDTYIGHYSIANIKKHNDYVEM